MKNLELFTAWAVVIVLSGLLLSAATPVLASGWWMIPVAIGDGIGMLWLSSSARRRLKYRIRKAGRFSDTVDSPPPRSRLPQAPNNDGRHGPKSERDPSLWAGVGVLMVLLLAGTGLLIPAWDLPERVQWRDSPEVVWNLGVGLAAAVPVALVVILVERKLHRQITDAHDRQQALQVETRTATGAIINSELIRFLERIVRAAIIPPVPEELSQYGDALDGSLTRYRGNELAFQGRTELSVVEEFINGSEEPWTRDEAILVYATIMHGIAWWHGPEDYLKKATRRFIAPSAQLSRLVSDISQPLLQLGMPVDWQELRRLSERAGTLRRRASQLATTSATRKEQGFFFYFFFDDNVERFVRALQDTCASICLRLSHIPYPEGANDEIETFKAEVETYVTALRDNSSVDGGIKREFKEIHERLQEEGA